jgi:hypothetical protein
MRVQGVGSRLIRDLVEPIATAYYAENPGRGPRDLAADLAGSEWGLSEYLDDEAWMLLLRAYADTYGARCEF